MSKIYWFGDSWVYGDELDDPVNECFAKLISEELGAKCVNLGKKATSIEYIVYQYMQVKNNIKDNDKVFFFLTDRGRTFIDKKNLLPGAWMDVTENIHPNNNEWYRYLDSDDQQQWSLDKNLFLLNSVCQNGKFANLFTINETEFVDENAWLLPSNKCIAQYILPYVNKGFNLGDHPRLTLEEWQEQKVFVNKYFASGGHPNKEGHKRIAEELCKLI